MFDGTLVAYHTDSRWGYTVMTVNGHPISFKRTPELTVNDPAKKRRKRKKDDEAEEES